MTRDEILNMPAGREMDTLVAETFCLNPLGAYSTSIFWALVLVDAVEGKGIPDECGNPLEMCRAALLAVMEV